MGIYGLYTYARNDCGSDVCKEINICDVIKANKLESGKDVLLIFEVSCLVYKQCKGLEGAMGGRPQIVIQKYKEFFEELIESGAVLVFFCDGQLQLFKVKRWCENQEKAWNHINKTNNDDNSVIRREKYLMTKEYRCHILFESLMQTIKSNNLGRIYTSTEVECDQAIVKYAHENGAFAVFSADTDFFIFEQEYKFWDLSTLHLKNRTITSIDRKKLKEFMKLTSDQMKILATIVGNDFTKAFSEKSIKINSVLDFCQNTEIDAIDTIHSEMVRLGFKFDYNNGMKIIHESLDFYDITNVNFPETSDNNFNFVKHVFKNEFYFRFDASFFDFQIRNQSDGKCLLDRFMEVFSKMGGIILRDDQDKKLKIVTKWDASEKYTPRDDVEPNFDFPVNSSNNSIWSKLLWCLGLDSDNDQYLDIVLENNRNILVTCLSILFLRKAKEINKQQAIAMLAVHNDISLEIMVYKELHIINREVDIEAIRTAQIFLSTFTLILDALHVCDLAEYKHPIYHDGVYYLQLIQFFAAHNNQQDFNEKTMKVILTHYMAGDSVLIDACRHLLSKY